MVNNSLTFDFVRLLIRLNPALADALKPDGPLLGLGGKVRAIDTADEVALNPQPLPPREMLRAATQQTAQTVAEAAIAAQIGGVDGRKILQIVADDWCLTPPGKIPWPRHWPHPWPPGEPYPITEEIDSVAPAVQALASLVFQQYASAVADPDLTSAFTELADRLQAAALSPRIA